MRGQGRGDGHLRWFRVPRGGAAIAPLDEDEMAVVVDPEIKRKRQPSIPSAHAKKSSASVLAIIVDEFLIEQSDGGVAGGGGGGAAAMDIVVAPEPEPIMTLSYFTWSFQLIDEYIDALKQRGSHQHSQEVRVFILLRILRDIASRRKELVHQIGDDDTCHGMTVFPSIKMVAAELHVGDKQIKLWMLELFATGSIGWRKQVMMKDLIQEMMQSFMEMEEWMKGRLLMMEV